MVFFDIDFGNTVSPIHQNYFPPISTKLGAKRFGDDCSYRSKISFYASLTAFRSDAVLNIFEGLLEMVLCLSKLHLIIAACRPKNSSLMKN